MTHSLASWNSDQQKQLRHTLACAKENKEAFAVFDADNTIWKHDLTEALMAWLTQRNILSLEAFPAFLLPVTPLPKESLFGYYTRLGQIISHSTSYLWSAQVFQGLRLGTLRQELKEMMKRSEPIPVNIYKDQNLVQYDVPIPYIFEAQRELISAFQAQKTPVWIVSASLEELVRMVLSDPHFGLNIPPENVIGVNMLIQRADGSVWSSAQHRQQGFKGDAYFAPSRLEGILTHHLYAPATWYAGKVAAIQEWIHPSIRPILVAGDSPNDFYMQFYANAMEGGTRLRIHRKESHKKRLKAEIQKRICSKSDYFDPEKGWLEAHF